VRTEWDNKDEDDGDRHNDRTGDHAMTTTPQPICRQDGTAPPGMTMMMMTWMGTMTGWGTAPQQDGETAP